MMDTTTETHVPDISPHRARTLLRGFLVMAAVVVLVAATMATTATAVLVLEVAAAVVVACVAIFVVTSLVAAALLAVAVRRGLRRMPPLEQLGRPFEASHDDVRITGVHRAGADEMVLDLMYAARRVVLLDEQGAPQSVEMTGPATTSRTITGAAALSEEQILVLEQLSHPGLDLSLVERGLVTVGGPVTRGWELRASNGIVVRALS